MCSPLHRTAEVEGQTIDILSFFRSELHHPASSYPEKWLHWLNPSRLMAQASL
jgi:hypothetical protein